MKLSSCFCLASAGALIVACGGSDPPPKEPDSMATPVPANGNWSAATREGTAPPTSGATTSSGVTTTAAHPAPAIAPQAPPPQPVAAGPCDSCRGLVSNELQSALNKRSEHDARKCYERVLTNNPSARASLGVEIRVGRDGTACDAVVQSDQPEWPGLADCVATEFRRGGFPSPGNNSCVIAKVPILFTPRVR